MSVCEYRAFIFLDQPPPWVSRTVLQIILCSDVYGGPAEYSVLRCMCRLEYSVQVYTEVLQNVLCSDVGWRFCRIFLCSGLCGAPAEYSVFRCMWRFCRIFCVQVYVEVLHTLETAWMKGILARRRWHRWYHAIIAMNRWAPPPPPSLLRVWFYVGNPIAWPEQFSSCLVTDFK